DVYSFFFSSRRRHTRSKRDWSSDVCSSDLLSNSSMSTGREAEMTNYFKTFGIDVIDGFSYNEFSDTITSNQEMIPYSRDKYAPSVDNVAEGRGYTMTTYNLQNGINTYLGFD